MIISNNKKYEAFKTYWESYGGFPALIDSPYLAGSLVATIVLLPLWWKKTIEGSYIWASELVSIVPAMLGFSLGAIAILVAFSDARLSIFIHKERSKSSYFLSVIATFFHFIIVQCLTLFCTLALMAYENRTLSGLAFFLFCYTIFSALASGAALFGFAKIIDVSRRPK